MSEILTYQDPLTKQDLFCVLVAPLGSESDQRLMLIRDGLRRLNLPISPISLEVENGGKPYLMSGKDRIEISLSHTKETIVVVVSKKARIGVDIEDVNRIVSDKLLNRIVSLIDENKIEPIRLWTIKEAFLKMTGSGLRLGMKNVKIVALKDNMFEASTENQHALVLSFLWEKKYISIAWDRYPDKVA